tara:strand:- start:7947 stop:9044 length:1098 start_codon:yes stop_codon:yes gene_type:complete
MEKIQMSIKELNKKQLYNLVWKKPMVEASKEFGLSDRGLAKLCERNSIPVPPRGYWAKIKAGAKIIKPPLITLGEFNKYEIVLRKRIESSSHNKNKPIEEQYPLEISEALVMESLPSYQIRVSKTLRSPHKVITDKIKEEELAHIRYGSYGSKVTALKIEPLEKRCRRILDALLKGLEVRGFSVSQAYQNESFISISHETSTLYFKIEEKFKHIRRKLTDEEKENRWSSDQIWIQYKEATGDLRIRLDTYIGVSMTNIIEDNKTPIEEQLNEFIKKVIVMTWRSKEKHQKEHQEYKLRYQKEELLRIESNKRDLLDKEISSWKKAQEIRGYIKLMSGKSDKYSTEWLSWVNSPKKSRPPSIEEIC